MWISHIEIYSKKFRVGYRTNFPVIQLHVSSCFHVWYKWLQLSNLAYAQQECAQVRARITLSRRKFLQKLSPFGQGFKKRIKQTFQSRNSARISRHHTSLVLKSIPNGSSVMCRCGNLCPAARQSENLKIRIRPWAYNYKSIVFLNTQILKYRWFVHFSDVLQNTNYQGNEGPPFVLLICIGAYWLFYWRFCFLLRKDGIRRTFLDSNTNLEHYQSLG